MSDISRPIRSYQRIFKPDRRIYQVDGRRIPVPGGVPLAGLAWALVALLAVLIFSTRSLVFTFAVAGGGALLGGSVRGWRGACSFAVAGFLGTLLVGMVLGWLAWPLRLIVLPVLVATLACHACPDGRPAHRYLRSLLLLRLRAARRTLDRPVPAEGSTREWAPQVWVAPDHHGPLLHGGRVHGPARLVFARRIVAVPARGRLVLRAAEGHRLRRGEQTGQVVELAAGQVAEVRP